MTKKFNTLYSAKAECVLKAYKRFEQFGFFLVLCSFLGLIYRTYPSNCNDLQVCLTQSRARPIAKIVRASACIRLQRWYVTKCWRTSSVPARPCDVAWNHLRCRPTEPWRRPHRRPPIRWTRPRQPRRLVTDHRWAFLCFGWNRILEKLHHGEEYPKIMCNWLDFYEKKFEKR